VLLKAGKVTGKGTKYCRQRQFKMLPQLV
jgi:hypothetical protein